MPLLVVTMMSMQTSQSSAQAKWNILDDCRPEAAFPSVAGSLALGRL